MSFIPNANWLLQHRITRVFFSRVNMSTQATEVNDADKASMWIHACLCIDFVYNLIVNKMCLCHVIIFIYSLCSSTQLLPMLPLPPLPCVIMHLVNDRSHAPFNIRQWVNDIVKQCHHSGVCPPEHRDSHNKQQK